MQRFQAETPGITHGIRPHGRQRVAASNDMGERRGRPSSEHPANLTASFRSEEIAGSVRQGLFEMRCIQPLISWGKKVERRGSLERTVDGGLADEQFAGEFGLG